MGNNIVKKGNNSKSSKIMKINGDYFKVKTPSKVIDIVKNYPNHILLDSQDFLLLNLRAKPLDLDFELKPKKIYLLFELPKFPQDRFNNNNNNIIKLDCGQKSTEESQRSALRRVRSNVLTTRQKLMTKRSISDLSMMSNPSLGRTAQTRVKVKLPKAEVKRIIAESSDDVEVARRILRLLATVDGGAAVVDAVVGGGYHGEEREEDVVERKSHCFDICGSQQRENNLARELIEDDDMMLPV